MRELTDTLTARPLEIAYELLQGTARQHSKNGEVEFLPQSYEHQISDHRRQRDHDRQPGSGQEEARTQFRRRLVRGNAQTLRSGEMSITSPRKTS